MEQDKKEQDMQQQALTDLSAILWEDLEQRKLDCKLGGKKFEVDHQLKMEELKTFLNMMAEVFCKVLSKK